MAIVLGALKMKSTLPSTIGVETIKKEAAKLEPQEHVVESPYITKEQRIEIPPLPFDGGFTLVIRPAEKLTKKQTVEVNEYFLGRQRGVYFGWVKDIGDEFGNDVDTQHVFLKEKLLLPVLEQESEKYRDLRSHLATIYKHGSEKEALCIRRQIAEMVSVKDGKDVNRHIMWLYMEDVQKFAMSQNIRLKMPVDYRTFKA